MRLLLLAGLCILVPSVVFAADPIRIIAIGDSITQGGRNDREEYTYRYPLFCMLKSAGVAVDFIGAHSEGVAKDATWPDCEGTPFDRDHEGFYGA